jgi:hypothetical protein
LTEKISTDQIQDALLRSGYLLESRLETVLGESKFYVEANTAYLDPETSKTRELDLYATKAYMVDSYENGFIFSVLLIEAINNPQPIAFITKESQTRFLHHEDIKLAGLPVKIPSKNGGNGWIFLPDFLEMNEYHHCCEGQISTQFCSFTQKKNQKGQKNWMAFHDEIHFNAFQVLSSATEYFEDTHYRSWSRGTRETINIEFYYPIVVLQGELIEIQPSHEAISIEPSDHIQYRRTSIIGRREINYEFDVVTEEYFPELIGTIKSEMEQSVQRLSKKSKRIQVAIKKIIEKAESAKTFDEIKNAFAFRSSFPG